MRPRRQKISGWGRFPVGETDVLRPDRMNSLAGALADGRSIVARGLGRSYGDSAQNSRGVTVLTERLDRFLGFDSETAVLHAEAGVSLEDILCNFVPRGFFLPVTPGTRHASLGGAVCADVHGKGHHVAGSFSNHVQRVRMLLADGRDVQCSRELEPDLFWATMGGMGLTGIVTEVWLKLRPIETAYLSQDIDKAGDLDETLGLFAGDSGYPYSVAWIDCLATGRSMGRSILMRGDWMRASDLPRKLADNPLELSLKPKLSVPIQLPSFTLNPLTCRAFNVLYHGKAPKHAEGVPTPYTSFFYPLDNVNNWTRIYGKRGFLQWQFVIPFDRGREGLVKIFEKLTRSGSASFLAVLKTFGKTEPRQLISFPSPGYMLALDFPMSSSLLPLLDELDKIVLEYGGRFYLAKDARMSPETFRAGYPRFDEWLEIVRRFDPDSRFQSDQSRRLGIRT